HRRQLGGDDETHSCGRTGRLEDEPGQRQERHLRPHVRDQLRGDERGERQAPDPGTGHAGPASRAAARSSLARASEDRAIASIEIVWTAAKPRSTGRGPKRLRIGPAASTATGCTVANTIIIVVITVGRSGGGMRSVSSAWMLGLTSPLPMPETARAAQE